MPRLRGEPPTRLTPREQEALRLLATGLTNREIAGRMAVATQTVQNALWRAYEKIGVRNRVEAAAWIKNDGGPKPRQPEPTAEEL